MLDLWLFSVNIMTKGSSIMARATTFVPLRALAAGRSLGRRTNPISPHSNSRAAFSDYLLSQLKFRESLAAERDSDVGPPRIP